MALFSLPAVLTFPNAEDFSSASGACALCCRASILQRNLFRVTYLFLAPAFQAIGIHIAVSPFIFLDRKIQFAEGICQ